MADCRRFFSDLKKQLVRLCSCMEEPEPRPNRYFLDRIAIDLDNLRAASLVEDLSNNVYCVRYEMVSGNCYEGMASPDKNLMERRLALVLSSLNRWNMHKISLLKDKNGRSYEHDDNDFYTQF